ncbi:MAG: extracellular solute-binding protein [Thermomicrobiales bacterium]|nr:extracellular solute-binding protein [Thermomicrobiales bacterium]MCO5224698.1 extracellular solute-binding protein [Thermomicrobiales bacterium]MCO5228828.1 extracellular solute-binding protein [Thermomicrobiales bacterium]
MNLRTNRRTFAKSAAFGAFSTASILSSSAKAQDSALVVDYWHRYGGSRAETLNVMAEMFNEIRPEYKVSAISQGDIAESNQKLRAAAAGGGLPAAISADDYDITGYTAAGILIDLDPFVHDPDLGFSEEEIAAFLPSQFDRHKLPIYDDRRMAFPQAFSAMTFWWNEDAIKAAGFDTPIETWDEFPDFLRKIVEANPGMNAWMEEDPGSRFMSIMKTCGVEWLKDDGVTPNFDAPEAVEILTWWKELYDEGLLQFTQSNKIEVFAAGQTAIMLHSSSAGPALASQVTGFTYNGGLPPQGANTDTLRTETYGSLNAVPRNSPELEQAGWEWIKWLASPEAFAVWVPASNYFPARTDLLEIPEIAAFYDADPVALKLLEEVAPAATILSPSAALTEVRGTIVPTAIEEVMMGKYTPEEGVMKMQAESISAIERAG